jgi:hypothetical protein
MTHLTSDELIDAMEGMLAPERHAHLAACPECQAQLTELASVLNEAKQSSVPEPSPLFWNHLSARVRAAIDAETGGALAHWFRWDVLLPVAAMAVLVLALAFNIRPAPDAAPDLAGNTAPEIDLAADNWGTLSELVGELDIETASAAGVIEPGVAEEALLHLTAEERQELTRLLEAEVTRIKSRRR